LSKLDEPHVADCDADPNRERVFTLDLKARASLKNASLKDETRQGGETPVLIEGTIGVLLKASFIDNLIFEVQGSKGILRIDLTSQEVVQSKKC
jgi:hypothetical protein